MRHRMRNVRLNVETKFQKKIAKNGALSEDIGSSNGGNSIWGKRFMIQVTSAETSARVRCVVLLVLFTSGDCWQ